MHRVGQRPANEDRRVGGGETIRERARYLARRLSEFHNEQSEPFFAPCAEPPTTGVTRPFQCQPPARPLDYEDFR